MLRYHKYTCTFLGRVEACCAGVTAEDVAALEAGVLVLAAAEVDGFAEGVAVLEAGVATLGEDTPVVLVTTYV